MTPRRIAAAVLVLFLGAAGSFSRSAQPAKAQSSNEDLVTLACSIPHEHLLRTFRGWRPDRGAQISFIAKEPNFVGSGLPHVGPWDYIQTVPMLWYGPGFIQARGNVKRPVTVADIAPTTADLLRFDGFTAHDGTLMDEALVPADQRETPKLLVTMVWDAGGMNVLRAHPTAWPYLRSIISEGTFYTDATVGSSPSSTAQIHATIGTGSFPRQHGLVGHNMLVGDTITAPWNQGPAFFVEPTLADIYDRAMDNDPIVGIVATADIHFGLLGHGGFFTGGDRDIALTRSVVDPETLTDEGSEWNLPEHDAPYYRLPDYANDVPGFEDDVATLDQADGKKDGKWRDNDIAELLDGFDTPARTPYQERVVETVVQREGFGRDETPDLLYLNFKEIDYVSHVWSMNSVEMRDAVVAQDEALEALVTALNRDVGKNQWVLNITADHGAMPDPAVSGGYQISTRPMQDLINGEFDTDGDDTPVVDLMQPTQAFLNTDELESNGASVDDVARFMMTFTQNQTAGGGVEPNAGQENDTVMRAAFPSSLMPDLPCLPEARR